VVMPRMTTAGVIATRNQDLYIAEAVESLAHQVNELIVVDDASTDRTRSILESLSYPNLTVLANEKRLGVSRSFRRAVDEASAEVLIIQGGDDRSVGSRVDAQIREFEDPRVSLVYSVPTVINGSGDQLPSELAAEFLTGIEADDPLAFLFFESNFVCAPSAAVRRADYLAFGGFPAGLDLLQDYALWLQLAAAGSFVKLAEPIVEYRKHGSNLSREYVGVDAPKQRRLAAELEFIRNDFLSRSSEETRQRLAGNRNLDLENFASLEPNEQIAVLQIAHPDKIILRRGLAFAFSAAGKADGEQQLARLGVSMKDLSTLAVAADHENLDEVGRALGAIRSIAKLVANN
jgi:glycosyltransferase involved in cell wall biosynthesis